MGVKNARRSISALLGAVVLGVGLVATGTAAYAAPGAGGTGDITVHKFAQPETATGLPNDGMEIPAGDLAGLTPLDDVGFTAIPINGLPLSVAGNWNQLNNLVVTLDPVTGEPILSGVAGATLGTPLTEEFTSSGIAEFTGLPADVAYVVYESSPLPGTTTVAQPAIVTVPYPGEGSTTWNYDIHLYPKNVLVNEGSSKTATVVGNTITFNISYVINSLGQDENGDVKYTQFNIEDTLGTGLTYQSSSVWLVDGTTRTAVPAAEYTSATSSNPLTLDFDNADGDGVLTYLQDNIGKTIEWEIVATAGPTATSVANTATLTVNGASWEVDVPTPQALFNGIYVMKEAMNRGATDPVPLAGAGFEIWTKPNAAAIASCPAYSALPTDDLEKADLGTLTSATNGRTAEVVLAAGAYCVYETVVPAGYKGAPAGELLTVSANGASVTLTNTQFGSNEGDLPGLPITGAAGRILLIIGAVALVSLAVGLYFVRRRRMNSLDS